MRDRRISGAVRIAAGALGLLLLALLLFSSFYPAAEADHDCTGEDCAVCVCIRLCENALVRFGSGVLLLAAAAPVLLFLAAAVHVSAVFPQETLISEKVRLNN